MDSAVVDTTLPIDVAVIGGGPSGLAAACALKAAGVERVVVFEREAQAGGIPRHCGHPPFGMREFRRILTGPEYAARLVAQALAAGVEIRTLATVAKVHPGGTLTVTSPAGMREITARRVIYATGVRETPRAARLISGARVHGVMNTGALQSMVYLKRRRPFARPVIVGTELVAFSALMTCRHAGIRPVAMIEAGPRATARWPSGLYPRLRGVPLRVGTLLREITGTGAVEGIVVTGPDGKEQRIECDGVVLTGRFTPEAALALRGHLEVDTATGGPRVDQWGRCSDPAYFATGNLLRPVETAGRCWAEGRLTGRWVARDLAGQLPGTSKTMHVSLRDPRLKYAMPHRISDAGSPDGMSEIQMRVTEPVSGILVASTQTGPVWRRALTSQPERRVVVPIAQIVANAGGKNVSFAIEGPAK